MEKFLLDGKWNIQSKSYNVEGNVPCSVCSVLLEKGLMEDPFYRDNEAKVMTVLDEEFTFTRTFNYEKKSSKIMLCCEGIDTLCSLYINGEHVADLNNMFRTYYFDVTKYLINGENTIKAVFPPYDKYIKEKNKERSLTSGTCSMVGFSYVRKAHYMSGWDWGPRIPDIGIFKSIYLFDDNIPRIVDVRILQRHEDGKVFLTVTPSTNIECDVVIKIEAPDGKLTEVKVGKETEIENPKLWWPNGYGEHPLYKVICQTISDGKVTDTNEKKVGLRTLVVSREKDEWGEQFCYKVNGIKIFAFGADYIPEDNILARLSRERTKELLKKCIFANYNSLRVWGGGFYPFDYFFELCDEMGIIIFIDLMFACTAYPFDKEFFDNTKCELEDNLRRIRYHACIALISGNNEIEEEANFVDFWKKDEQEGYLKYFEGLVPEIIKNECPEISFVPSSPSSYGGFNDPSGENVGDQHYWMVWHGNLPFTEYRKHFFRFLSEFGFQSFPSLKTIESFTLPSDRNPFSRVMELHQRNASANGKILNYMSQTYLYPSKFEDLVYASQLLQAEAIKYGVEHLRRNRGRCMGTLYWQFNDCWPVASWSSVDSNGRLKALHYEAKRFYEPIHISCVETGEYTGKRKDITDERIYDYETKAQLFVNNDTLEDVNGIIEWKLFDNESKELMSQSVSLNINALSVKCIDEIDFMKTDVKKNYLWFSFKVDGEIVSSGTVLFTKPKHFEFVDPELEVSTDGDFVTVTSKSYARYVYIFNENDDLILNDNFFDMNKGTRKIKIISGKADNLKVKSVYDIR